MDMIAIAEPETPKGIDDLLLLGRQPTVLDGEDVDRYITQLVMMDAEDSSHSQADESILDNTIRNGESVFDEDGNSEFFPYPMEEILESIGKFTKGYPKRVETALFIKSTEANSISWLMKRSCPM